MACAETRQRIGAALALGRARGCAAHLDHVHEEDLGAQRVAVSDDGLVAVVADRHAALAVPAVQLHAAAAALQHLGVLLCGRDASELVAREVRVVAGIDPVMAEGLRHVSRELRCGYACYSQSLVCPSF
jgi:hypothetical protein